MGVGPLVALATPVAKRNRGYPSALSVLHVTSFDLMCHRLAASDNLCRIASRPRLVGSPRPGSYAVPRRSTGQWEAQGDEDFTLWHVEKEESSRYQCRFADRSRFLRCGNPIFDHVGGYYPKRLFLKRESAR